jgi:competence ComEA-like helix-hairpin-helix protein
VNGEFLRGEVYFLLYENRAMFNGSKAHRPVLIVSSNRGNEAMPFVQILSLTTTVKYGFLYPAVESTGKTSYVKCNEIQSVPKDDLDKYVCTLTESEMEAVDRAMLVSLGLNDSVTDGDGDEIEKLNDRIAELEDELDDIVIQRDTWKRMYDKAIDKLADKKMEAPAPVVKKVEFVAEEPQEPVEINTCTAEELRKIGCTPTMIHNIIEKRPYQRVEDLKAVPSVTQIGYKLIESRICCVPVEKPKNVERVPKVKPQKVETPKLNINTCTAKELSKLTGLSENLMYAITGYRKREGNYSSLEELADVPRLPSNFLERFADKLTV